MALDHTILGYFKINNGFLKAPFIMCYGDGHFCVKYVKAQIRIEDFISDRKNRTCCIHDENLKRKNYCKFCKKL